MPAGDAKSYLISFLATLEGDKAVIQGIKRMESELRKTKDAMGIAEKGATGFGAGLAKLVLRAVAVIPIWMALRGAYMGLIRTTGDAIRATIEFEESLARIRTVVSANSTSIEADMAVVTQKILDLALTTRVPLKELADAMYFLRSADLTTAESIDALDSVLNLAVGTMNSVEESARAVAGIYNTMGDVLGENLTTHEKFQKIADVLAFTYSVQEVQLNELLAGYAKLAPFVGGLSDSFLELTTLLGVLNTRLLKSGRAGTLTAQTILQLTKNANKLAEVFGITFDPSQPISLIKTLEEMNNIFNTQGKLTQKQSDMLTELFGARGIVVPQLLLSAGGFENLSEAISLATKEAEGYAQRMREVREMTVQAQLERTKNIFASLVSQFLSASSGAIDLAHTLDALNDGMVESQGSFKNAGETVNFYLTNIKLLIDKLYELQGTEKGLAIAQAQSRKQFLQSIPGIQQLILGFTGAKIAIDKLIGTFGISREELQENKKALEDQFNLDKQLAQAQEKDPQERQRLAEEKRQQNIKEIRQELEHQIKIMKALGASELDIAKVKEKSLEKEKEYIEANELVLESQSRRNEVIEEELKLRKQISDEVMDAQLESMRLMGASELEVLKAKEKQLINSKGLISDSQLLLELSKNRLEQEIALANEKQKEWDLASKLFQQFVKADDLGKENLRRVIELVQLKPDELATRYNTNMFDKNLIDDYFSSFSQLGQEAINKVRAEMFDLPVDMPEEGQFDAFRGAFPLDLANDFGINLESGMLKAVESFKQAFQEAMQSVNPSTIETNPTAPLFRVGDFMTTNLGQAEIVANERKEKIKQMQLPTKEKRGLPFTSRPLETKVNIERIDIKAEGLNAEDVGEQVKQKVKEELEKPSTQKKLGKTIASYTEI
jgi:TP901 family phage tail tape measure protein